MHLLQYIIKTNVKIMYSHMYCENSDFKIVKKRTIFGRRPIFGSYGVNPAVILKSRIHSRKSVHLPFVRFLTSFALLFTSMMNNTFSDLFVKELFFLLSFFFFFRQFSCFLHCFFFLPFLLENSFLLEVFYFNSVQAIMALVVLWKLLFVCKHIRCSCRFSAQLESGQFSQWISVSFPSFSKKLRKKFRKSVIKINQSRNLSKNALLLQKRQEKKAVQKTWKLTKKKEKRKQKK